MKREKIHILKGKDDFTVSDLIMILSKLKPETRIYFSTQQLGSNNLEDSAVDENFRFRLGYQDRDDEWDDDYYLQIITTFKK